MPRKKSAKSESRSSMKSSRYLFKRGKEDGDGMCGGCCGGMSFHRHAHKGCLYGLGFIGAAIYYVGTATSFWGGVLGVLKAVVWPAFVVYKLLGM